VSPDSFAKAGKWGLRGIMSGCHSSHLDTVKYNLSSHPYQGGMGLAEKSKC
jgi:hypothetical protein